MYIYIYTHTYVNAVREEGYVNFVVCIYIYTHTYANDVGVVVYVGVVGAVEAGSCVYTKVALYSIRLCVCIFIYIM
jgi:hypothetical protein